MSDVLGFSPRLRFGYISASFSSFGKHHLVSPGVTVMFFKFCTSSKPPEDLRHCSLLIKQRTLLYLRGTRGVLTSERSNIKRQKTRQALFFKLTRHPLCSKPWHPWPRLDCIFFTGFVFRCLVNGDRLYLSRFKDSSSLFLFSFWWPTGSLAPSVAAWPSLAHGHVQLFHVPSICAVAGG